MGYLSTQGKLLTFSEYKKYCEQYKIQGIKEFIELFKAHKDVHKTREELKWGEEMEYNLFYFDSASHKIYLSNDGFQLIDEFNDFHQDAELHLQPEFGNWMVEAVPSIPYNSTEQLGELLQAYNKLSKRRHILNYYFTQYGLALTSMSSPPILGTEDYILLNDQPLQQELAQMSYDLRMSQNQTSQSQFIYDNTENPHPRFKGLIQSIRERRGEKVKILVPIYPDNKTEMNQPTLEEPYPGMVYMDSMHFGMGCSCLQVTFETQTINHARYLHDMLLPFTPIFAALSASAPIYKGKLANIDMRWTVISQSVDCRTEEERDPNNPKFIPKSRYSSMNHYISNHQYVHDKHFDSKQYKVSQAHRDLLQKDGEIDDRLAFHIASLFVRDPVPAYEDEIFKPQDPKETTSHFENLQSTNWNSLRFKPPPSLSSKIGWRVEFRTMDIQITDYENAAMIVILGMLVNVINHYDLDFIIPISKIDKNMDKAHDVDALFKQKFWFKVNILKNGQDLKPSASLQDSDYLTSNNYEQYTDDDQLHELFIYEILEGKPEFNFLGLYKLFTQYMHEKNYHKDEVAQVMDYMHFILDRSKGTKMSGARYIRNFVLNHEEYKNDSIVPNKISYDLMQDILEINSDPKRLQEYLGFKELKQLSVDDESTLQSYIR